MSKKIENMQNISKFKKSFIRHVNLRDIYKKVFEINKLILRK